MTQTLVIYGTIFFLFRTLIYRFCSVNVLINIPQIKDEVNGIFCELGYAVFTRDIFTWSKLTFPSYCVTFSIVKMQFTSRKRVSCKHGNSDTCGIKLTGLLIAFLPSERCSKFCAIASSKFRHRVGAYSRTSLDSPTAGLIATWPLGPLCIPAVCGAKWEKMVH